MSAVAKKEYTTIEAAGREVRLSSPSKVYFPKPGFTKLDLAEYYLAVADAAVNQLRERPGTMKRFVDGATGEFFFQKRVPKNAPHWLQTATFTFPSGRTATELVVNDAAHLVWAVNLGVSTSTPTLSAAPTSTAPTSSASTSTRSRACAGTRSARWRCA